MAKSGIARDQGEKLRTYSDMTSLKDTWDEGRLILMYHAIEAPPLNQGLKYRYLYVDPQKFHEQLAELQASGVRLIRADELTRPHDEPQALITLDDGFQNVFTHAMPILQALKAPAITYIVAGQIGGSNVWDHRKAGLVKRPLMSREEILEWVKAGFEIGAHTMTHPNLANLMPADARREIFDSKKVLEDLIGYPVRHFCYPYGGYNATVRDFVKEAGYLTATTIEGGYNFAETDKFKLKRLTAMHKSPGIAAWTSAAKSIFS